LGGEIYIIDKIAFDGAVIVGINNKEQTISREVAKNLLVSL
jgi:hypothetical protein